MFIELGCKFKTFLTFLTIFKNVSNFFIFFKDKGVKANAAITAAFFITFLVYPLIWFYLLYRPYPKQPAHGKTNNKKIVKKNVNPNY